MKQAKDGDPLKISAKEWNDVRLATQMVLGGQIGADKRPGQRWTDEKLSIRVKNTTGGDLERFDVLAIDDMVFNLEDDKEGTIGLPCLKLRDIEGQEDRGNVVVVQSAIKAPTAGNPGIDKAVMSGVTAAFVEVEDEDHRYIDVGDAARSFVSSSSGGVGRIIWKPAGTGRHLCMVLIGGFGGGGGGLEVIEFAFGDLEYPEEVPELCEDREPVDSDAFVAKVLKVRCGGAHPVYGEDSEGFVDVVDDLGILEGRDYRALPGKVGIAVLLKRPDLDEYGQPRCEWVIVYVHFYVEEHFIRDWIVAGNQIRIERAKGKFLDYCITGTEVIEGIVCEDSDDYGYGYGGGI